MSVFIWTLQLFICEPQKIIPSPQVQMEGSSELTETPGGQSWSYINAGAFPGSLNPILPDVCEALPFLWWAFG